MDAAGPGRNRASRTTWRTVGFCRLCRAKAVGPFSVCPPTQAGRAGPGAAPWGEDLTCGAGWGVGIGGGTSARQWRGEETHTTTWRMNRFFLVIQTNCKHFYSFFGSYINSFGEGRKRIQIQVRGPVRAHLFGMQRGALPLPPPPARRRRLCRRSVQLRTSRGRRGTSDRPAGGSRGPGTPPRAPPQPPSPIPTPHSRST